MMDGYYLDPSHISRPAFLNLIGSSQDLWMAFRCKPRIVDLIKALRNWWTEQREREAIDIYKIISKVLRWLETFGSACLIGARVKGDVHFFNTLRGVLVGALQELDDEAKGRSLARRMSSAALNEDEDDGEYLWIPGDSDLIQSDFIKRTLFH